MGFRDNNTLAPPTDPPSRDESRVNLERRAEGGWYRMEGRWCRMAEVVVGPREASKRCSCGAMTSLKSAVQARGCRQRVGRRREGGRRVEREARRGAREGRGGVGRGG